MTSVDLFDGQSCCGSSANAEQAARAVARFVADAEWLKARGVTVRRLSLSSEPGEFLRSQLITELLSLGGMGALPAVVVDGDLKCSRRYPSRAELAQWCGLPDDGAADETVSYAPGYGSGCATPSPVASPTRVTSTSR